MEADEVGLIDFGGSIVFSEFTYPFAKTSHNDILPVIGITKNAACDKFPRFSSPSNLRYFEHSTILPYIDKLNKEEGATKARGFFKNYLMARSDFHAKKAEFLEQQTQAKTPLTKRQLRDLKAMVKYERLQAKIFRNPSEKIMNLELLRIQSDFAVHLASLNEFLGQNYPRAFFRQLQSLACIKDFNQHIKTFSKSSTPLEIKEYLDFQRKYGGVLRRTALLNLGQLFKKSLRKIIDVKGLISEHLHTSRNVKNMAIATLQNGACG